MRFEDLTEKDIEVLRSRNDELDRPVHEILNVSPATVPRWRRKLGITVKLGSPPGKRPEKMALRETRKCLMCDNTFTVIIHHDKKYCSQSCQHIGSKESLSKRAKERWKNPTENMLAGIEKRKNPKLSEYKIYSGKVRYLSERMYEKYKEEINPNDHPRTICGVEGGYQLDHIISIKFGFENNIPPEILAEKINLRMLPWRENLLRYYGKI